jgi:putative radical SAM enzyme (TIGR03279 family)
MDSPKRQFSPSAYVRKTNDQDVERRIRAQHEYRHAMPARKNASVVLRVVDVEPGSLAARLGFSPGEEILEVNGEPLLDVIDFQFRVAVFGEPLSIRTRARTVECVREEYESFGAEFEPIEPLVCDNDCVFCFVHQNPGHTRRSLRIKDEDYRLSFLFGNYLTLTNVGDRELERIIDQRLSPLYISVHATEPGLRARMLGNRAYDGLDSKLDRMTEAGIRLHCQVVLCPGWNDGPHLERTISDLAARYPGVQSVAVVPVGLTDHRDTLPVIEPVTGEYARRTICHVGGIQRRFLDRWDTPFVFLGDEFYILAGEAVPPGDHYREFPQIENGVGMVRSFLDEFGTELASWTPGSSGLRGTIATGKLFHSHLKTSIGKLGLDLRTVAVESRFWGAGINVAGLLTGSDIVSGLRDRVFGDFVMIPSEAMIGEEGLFLDDMKRADVERELGVPVLAAGYNPAEFFGVIGSLGSIA